MSVYVSHAAADYVFRLAKAAALQSPFCTAAQIWQVCQEITDLAWQQAAQNCLTYLTPVHISVAAANVIGKHLALDKVIDVIDRVPIIATSAD